MPGCCELIYFLCELSVCVLEVEIGVQNFEPPKMSDSDFSQSANIDIFLRHLLDRSSVMTVSAFFVIILH